MEIRRKGILWQSGMLLKFCKGSLPQMKNKDFYAILEYILADGFPDEKGTFCPILNKLLLVTIQTLDGLMLFCRKYKSNMQVCNCEIRSSYSKEPFQMTISCFI